MTVDVDRPPYLKIQRTMTGSQLRFPSLRGILTVMVFLAIGGCTAWSLNPWARKAARVNLDEGHFHDGVTGKDMPTSAVIERLAEADVVFLGEFHDQPTHRGFQLALLEKLLERAPDLALGLEFFSREDQPLLDDLALGHISEVAFRSRVRAAGGYPYRDLLRLARKRGIRLSGLNLPRRVVSRVASRGWESLSAAERARWPKPSEASPDYRRLVKKAYTEFEGHHKADFQQFLTAQTLWDSTMAESIHRNLEEHKARPLVVVVGMMHVAYGLGIPSRLDARTPASTAIVVHSGTLQGDREFPERPIADYIWYPDSILAAASNWSGNLSREELAP
jgi:uncharacterized iron-regulated protein